jgi:hypothetical protein
MEYLADTVTIIRHFSGAGHVEKLLRTIGPLYQMVSGRAQGLIL